MAVPGSQSDSSAARVMETLHIDDGTGQLPKTDKQFKELQLTDQERQILELYDRLEEIRLEIAIVEADGSLMEDESEAVSEQDLRSAQEALLEAKARYNLRNTIIESVLVANPILRAVHATDKATAIERDLLPLISERDTVSASLTNVSERTLEANEKLMQLQAEHIIVSRKNAELAAEMLVLAEKASKQKKEDIQDPDLRREVAELDANLKISRQRYRIMKGTASAVVAGSGLDWARDKTLRDMVMDDDND